MKKIILVICLIVMLLLCACTADFSATESDLLPETLSNTEAFDIFAQTFCTEQKDCKNGGVIAGMLGPFGSFEAQTRDRVLFRYQTESMNNAYLLAYDKQSGTFSYACPDALCNHESCLYGGEYRIFAGEYHLFFQPIFAEQGKAQYYYCTDTDGNGAAQISVTTDCPLLCETEKGLYYSKTTLDGETYKTALWLYDFASDSGKQLTEEGELWEFYVADGAVYLYDTPHLTLSALSDDLAKQTVLAQNVTAVYVFDGALYLHDMQTETICKVTRDTVLPAFDVQGIEFGVWCVSGGDLYYTCHDRAYIESQAENAKLHVYLDRYNLSCGRIYRIKANETNAELVFAGEHGGIPDLIQNFFADGSTLYIEYRDYKSYKNNYNSKRQGASLMLADADTGAFLDIPGR